MMSTLGFVISHRASITFCWLPPDRWDTNSSIEDALIWRLSICSATWVRSSSSFTRPMRVHSRRKAARALFFRMDWVSTSPSPRRSWVT